MWVNILIDTNIKDMNVFMVLIITIIMMFVPLTFFLANEIEFEALYKDVPEIL